MKEIWKDVKGYDGDYKVSNLSRVKSFKWGKERLLKSWNDGGYYCVGLIKEKKRSKKRVHQLMAIAFLDHNPDGFKMVVDHIDNNPLNNNLANLQVITHRLNASKDRKGTSKYIGVHWNNKYGGWSTQIQIKGKRYNLGRFKCELAAAKAYNDRLKDVS